MPGFIDSSNLTSREVQRMGHADDCCPSSTKPDYQPLSNVNYTYPACLVWAAAVAIHRINEGYFTEDVWMRNATPPYRAKQANRTMLQQWARNNNFVEVTPDDIIKGQKIHDYFRGYMLSAISGKITSFQKEAYLIAQMSEFTTRNIFELSVVSCLPRIYEKARENYFEEI